MDYNNILVLIIELMWFVMATILIRDHAASFTQVSFFRSAAAMIVIFIGAPIIWLDDMIQSILNLLIPLDDDDDMDTFFKQH